MNSKAKPDTHSSKACNEIDRSIMAILGAAFGSLRSPDGHIAAGAALVAYKANRELYERLQEKHLVQN